MIDLHIHILPGLDDGAADMEEAAEMAEIAAFSGTSVIAATPHCNMAGIFDTIWGGEYQEKWQSLRRVLAERGIPLTVAAGMELFGTADLPEKLRAGELITLNNSRYPLVEFDFQAAPCRFPAGSGPSGTVLLCGGKSADGLRAIPDGGCDPD